MMSYVPKNRLLGKIAIVTASTDGIGFEIARRLLQEGSKVILGSRRQENVDGAVKKLASEGLNAVGLTCHVSNAEQRKKLFDMAKSLGGLDIIVSNAAVNPTLCNFVDCDERAWDKMFDVNLKAAFLLTKECLPLFKKRGGGSIVYMSSISAFHTMHHPDDKSKVGVYGITKTALQALAKAAAYDLGKDNIRVNCVAPGLIQTKFLSHLGTPEQLKFFHPFIPMKRLGYPDDISGVVAFLVSDDAKYITGETIVPAGGIPSSL